jgi:glutamate/tyrosine decarboxylase-like PLP-dependent enzyme
LAQVGNTPLIVCLQAGNVHSGAFDPIAEAVDLAHQYGAWVHVDGAFGLWAAASAQYRHLVAGVERADSWASDAHKTLNVPYDSGLAIVAKADAMYAAMGVHAAYLIQDERPDPFSTVPVVSRSGPRCVRWAAGEWPRWWSGFVGMPVVSLPDLLSWMGCASSTMWCSPRSASHSAPMRQRAR